jgi:hypothetical protein
MVSDSWTAATDFSAQARAYGVAEVVNGKAYVGAGFIYDGAQHYFKDWYAFGFPTAVGTMNQAANEFACYPNPVTTTIYISTSLTNAVFQVCDITGRQVLSGKQGRDNVIDVSGLKAGTYIVELASENIRSRQIIVIDK